MLIGCHFLSSKTPYVLVSGLVKGEGEREGRGGSAEGGGKGWRAGCWFFRFVPTETLLTGRAALCRACGHHHRGFIQTLYSPANGPVPQLNKTPHV